MEEVTAQAVVEQLPVTEEPKAEPTESAPEVPVEKPKEEVGSKFAALARKEKALWTQSQQIKAEREAFQRERESFQKELDEVRTRRQEAKKNPMKWLEYGDLTYKDTTDYILAGEKPTPEMIAKMTVEERLAAYEAEKKKEDEKKAQEAKQKQEEQYQKSISDFKAQIGEFIKTNSDEYELINLYEEEGLVYETIEAHFEKTQKEKGVGKVLTIKEASDLVETYLLSLWEKGSNTKKVKAKAQIQPKESPKQSQTKEVTKTLSNQLTPSAEINPRVLTREERIKRAMAVGRS